MNQLQLDQLITKLTGLATEQEALGCEVYVRVGTALFPVMDAEYDPGVEPESYVSVDDDGVEVEIEEDEGEEPIIILKLGEPLSVGDTARAMSQLLAVDLIQLNVAPRAETIRVVTAGMKRVKEYLDSLIPRS